MFCENCGARISEKAKFCRSCGTAVQLIQEVPETPMITEKPEAPIAEPARTSEPTAAEISSTPQMTEAVSDPKPMETPVEETPEEPAQPELATVSEAPESTETVIPVQQNAAETSEEHSESTLSEPQEISQESEHSTDVTQEEAAEERSDSEESFSDLVCPVCGAPLETDAKFCTSCRRCVDPARGFSGVDPEMRKKVVGTHFCFRVTFRGMSYLFRDLLCRRHHVWFEQTGLKIGKIMVKRIPYQQIASIQVMTKMNMMNLIYSIILGVSLLIWIAAVFLADAFSFGFLICWALWALVLFLVISCIHMKCVVITDNSGRKKSIPLGSSDATYESDQKRFLYYLKTMTGIVERY